MTLTIAMDLEMNALLSETWRCSLRRDVTALIAIALSASIESTEINGNTCKTIIGAFRY